MNVTVENLSNDQRVAYDDIMRWIDNRALGATRDKDLLSLGGYAGSGKSTLVSLVANQIDLPAFCAFTGKATSVLRRKLKAAGTETIGAQRQRDDLPSSDKPFCGTIHQLIYAACECREPEVVEDTDENGKIVRTFVYPEKDENGNCVQCGGDGWHRREALDRQYGLIIVDEASMVDDSMLSDLRGYGVPILAVGDHGQLPPVRGTGSLMKSPDLRLEQIHRQAEGNPIIALSKLVREEGRLPSSMNGGDVVQFFGLRYVEDIIRDRYAGASPERMLEMGLACYTNRRRVGLNESVRRARGTAGTPPKEGEHLICLRNMGAKGGRLPVANGMRGVLVKDVQDIPGTDRHVLGSVAFPEDGIEARPYDMLIAQFGREKTFQTVEDLVAETGLRSFYSAGALFDFGYAMTVHKMQGSQFDDLVVCAERGGYMTNEDWKRWLYTAVTRASKKLTVLW